MKKLVTLLSFLVFIYNATAQNTFPTTGNVGIGTTTPAAKLDIGTGGGSAIDLRVGGRIQSNSIYGGLWLSDTNDGFVGNNEANIGFYTSGGGWASFQINKTSGNVGIGTTTPAYKLDVAGTINATNILVNGQPISGGGASQWVTNGTAISYAAGNVGVGTTAPDGFQVNLPLANENAQPTSNIRIGMLGSTPRIILDKAGSVPFEIDNAGGQLRIFNPGAVRLVVNSNGYVGIGTAAPDAALTVKGTIHTNEVKVDLLGAVAPDYVFEPTYDLKPLAEIETYIKENKHLPEVPSAKEMEKNGVRLGEMNMLLLKKVEELTLYLLKMNEENRLLKIENDKQNEAIEFLKSKIK